MSGMAKIDLDAPPEERKAKIKGYLAEVRKAQAESANKKVKGLNILNAGPSANAIVPLLKSAAAGAGDEVIAEIEEVGEKPP